MQMHGRTGRHTQIQTDGQIGRQADTQSDRQTDRQADRQTDRQAGRQTHVELAVCPPYITGRAYSKKR